MALATKWAHVLSPSAELVALYVASGIRYVSRLGNYECWAIFDGTEVETYETHSIELDDPDLQRIAQEYSRTLHR
jgi:hypothetical protein